MRISLSETALLFLVASAVGCEAFQSPAWGKQKVGVSETSLNAMPPMIIGPMIRKYREEQERKKTPMATRDEAKSEAPGLRVGQAVWKWPPIWPYDQDFFTPTEDIPKPKNPMGGANGLASMMSGTPQLPTPEVIEETEEEDDKLKPLEYWGVEQRETEMDLDADAAAKLTNHLEFYLKDGMSVLEFGAAENSYLPKDLKLGRHVGVGANQFAMDKNPSLTESLVVDLNVVVPDRDVDNDELRSLASEPFDAIIMTNTVDFLTNPREVFRSAWYLLKPGGIMINAFSSKDMYKDKFQRAQTQMWRAYNDDQHMWICGSFFEFSAGDGWEKLLGFDISPESAKQETDGPMAVFAQGESNNMYVVQAIKVEQDDRIDMSNLEKSINSRMWMLPGVEPRDKNLVCNRLARSVETAAEPEKVTDIISNNMQFLAVIYEALNKMDQFAFTFSMQSQLAADLISDPNFVGNDEQMTALKQGLGLRTPSKEFWEPVGVETGAMEVEEKISLLSFLVPRCGSGNAEQEAALEAFVSGLKPMFALLRSRLPNISESDVQLLGTELLAAEVLVPGRSSRSEFATWVAALSNEELEEFLKVRKQIRVDAKQEMYEYQDQREEARAAYKAQQEKMQEQVALARKERSLIFNPRTEKFEVYEQK